MVLIKAVENILFDTVSLITIFNPVAGAAIMLSLVNFSQIRDVAKKTSLVVFISSLITMFTGGLILKLFGINIPSIKAIGGVVLLIMSLNMIQGKEFEPTKTSHSEHSAAKDKDDIAIIPLAIPIIFGPGAITTLIVLNEKYNHFIYKIDLVVAIFITSLITYIVLRNAVYISKFLGVHGLKITTRLMGLIIGAIAFLFLVGGIKALWIMK